MGNLSAQITKHGAPPELVDCIVPTPLGKDQLVLQVVAAPITPLDVLCATGESYFGARNLPYTPGVQGVGFDEFGKRYWFTTTAGMADGNGSWATHCLVERSKILEVTADISDVALAALGLSAVAAWGALRRAGFKSGDRVVVLGAAGLVGSTVVQLARHDGAAEVIAIRRGPDPILGADHTIDSTGSREQVAQELNELLPGGANVVVDTVWGGVSEIAISNLAPNGVLVNLGDSGGPTASFASAVVRSKSIDIRGYTNLSLTWAEQCEALTELIDLVVAGKVEVKAQSFELSRVDQAWATHLEGRSGIGRIVLIP